MSLKKICTSPKIQNGEMSSPMPSDQEQDSEDPSPSNLDQKQKSMMQELKKKQEYRNSKQYRQGETNDRRRMFQSQRLQELRKLDQLNKEQIWLFIYNNQNSALEECVKDIKSIKTFTNSYGWDVKINKEEARKLISDGFKAKKVFAKIQVGKKNYDDYSNRHQQEKKKRYVVKEQKQDQDDEMVKSQFTFQKKKKSQNERGEKYEEKRGQRRNQHNGKNSENQHGEQRQERKDIKMQISYKNDPRYQGLGNFRNKPKRSQQIQTLQNSQTTLDEQQSIQTVPSTNSHSQYQNKPKYVQKTRLNKYKQKPRKPGINYQSSLKKYVEQIKPTVMISEDSSPAPSSPSKTHQQSQVDHSLDKRVISPTKSDSPQLICQQPVNELCQPEVNHNSEKQDDVQVPSNATETEAKKKKKKKPKNKDPKPKPVSNNPFDVFRN